MSRKSIRTDSTRKSADTTKTETAPTAAQLGEEFLRWRFGMFLHFGPATFHEREWACGYEDPSAFAPDKLDCGQWADAAAAAGMKYAVLTSKHTCGWCLWNGRHTANDMKSFLNYKKGKGDIVREFTAAFRSRGMKVGLYYCFPGDFSAKTLPPGKPDLHGLPPEAKNDYAGFIKKQFTELLTQYGPIDLLWIDQYISKYAGDWKPFKAHAKSIQPNCIVIANNSRNTAETDIHGFEYPYHMQAAPERALPSEDNKTPSEVCDKIGPGWFWSRQENTENLKTVEEITAMLKLCNSRRANYLLNVAPDTTGLIPDASVARLRKVGAVGG